jgi:hypothetical protein
VRNLRRVGRLGRVKPTSPRGKTPKGVLDRTVSGFKVSPREDEPKGLGVVRVNTLERTKPMRAWRFSLVSNQAGGGRGSATGSRP